MVVWALVATGAMAMLMPAARAATHTVDVTIVAGKSASDGGFDFNGYQRGAMKVTVPTGWQVTVHFRNVNVVAHSLAVSPAATTQQAVPSATPVFSGAMTTDLAKGLPKGTKQTFTFTANTPGTYEFLCGVPGHAIAGMWDTLLVSSTAKSPTVTPTGAAPIVAK